MYHSRSRNILIISLTPIVYALCLQKAHREQVFQCKVGSCTIYLVDTLLKNRKHRKKLEVKKAISTNASRESIMNITKLSTTSIRSTTKSSTRSTRSTSTKTSSTSTGSKREEQWNHISIKLARYVELIKLKSQRKVDLNLIQIQIQVPNQIEIWNTLIKRDKKVVVRISISAPSH